MFSQHRTKRQALACIHCRAAKVRCAGSPPSEVLTIDVSQALAQSSEDIESANPCERCKSLGRHCLWKPCCRTGRPRKRRKSGVGQEEEATSLHRELTPLLGEAVATECNISSSTSISSLSKVVEAFNSGSATSQAFGHPSAGSWGPSCAAFQHHQPCTTDNDNLFEWSELVRPSAFSSEICEDGFLRSAEGDFNHASYTPSDAESRHTSSSTNPDSISERSSRHFAYNTSITESSFDHDQCMRDLTALIPEEAGQEVDFQEDMMDADSHTSIG